MLNREQVRNALRKSSAPRLSQAIHSARHCAAGAFIRHDTTAWASMAAHVSLKDAGHRRATYAELHAYLTQLQRRLPWAVIYITSFSDFSFGVLLGSKNWSAECVYGMHADAWWDQSVMSLDWTHNACRGGIYLLSMCLVDATRQA